MTSVYIYIYIIYSYQLHFLPMISNKCICISIDILSCSCDKHRIGEIFAASLWRLYRNNISMKIIMEGLLRLSGAPREFYTEEVLNQPFRLLRDCIIYNLKEEKTKVSILLQYHNIVDVLRKYVSHNSTTIIIIQ